VWRSMIETENHGLSWKRFFSSKMTPQPRDYPFDTSSWTGTPSKLLRHRRRRSISAKSFRRSICWWPTSACPSVQGQRRLWTRCNVAAIYPFCSFPGSRWRRPEDSPTLTLEAATRAATILGTAAYMSPEQALGKAADKRADIWSFGAVLYEVLSGRLAFGGESTSDILAAVLKLEPDWSALPEETPAPIRQLIRRCRRNYNERTLGIQLRAGSNCSSGAAGAISKLLIAADLLKRGYAVFRALSPSCPCDLAILHNGQLLAVEGRTGYAHRITNTVTFAKLKTEADIYGVYVHRTREARYFGITSAGTDFLKSSGLVPAGASGAIQLRPDVDAPV
jgi:serine/threonine protein kinase